MKYSHTNLDNPDPDASHPLNVRMEAKKQQIEVLQHRAPKQIYI